MGADKAAAGLFSLWFDGKTIVAVALAAALIVGLLAIGRIPLMYNLQNLAVRRRTTGLTLLAFVLVIGLLVMMMAFVNGMYALTESSGRPGNVVVLAEGSTDESFSNLGFSDVGEIEFQPGIVRRGDKPLVSREAYYIVNQPIPPTAGDAPERTVWNFWGLVPAGKKPTRRFLQIRGIDEPQLAAEVHQLSLYDGGTWFTDAGVRTLPAEQQATNASHTTTEAQQPDAAAAIEAVVGEGIAGQLARDQGLDPAVKPRLDVGDRFQVKDRTWVVVGVLQSEGLTFDSEIWAKRALVGPLLGKEGYSSLVAYTGSVPAAAKFKQFLNNDYKKAKLNAQVETEYYESLSKTNTQFLVAIVFLTVIVAIGGVFGVMNTMFAAIGQRTRDIGVLRLLGFTRLQVLASFLLESIVISLIGGALGCAIGSLCHGATANSVVSGSGGGGKFVVLRLTVDADTIALGMLLALMMGVIGGFLPAVKAVRLRILNSLR
jgi:putative ABC transport system permease protein